MSGFSDDDLRAAFQANDKPTSPDVPDADRIWDAASGTAPVEVRQAVADEMATNPEAALLWRLARELQDGDEPTMEAKPKTTGTNSNQLGGEVIDLSKRRRWQGAGAVLAAVAATFAGVTIRSSMVDDDPSRWLHPDEKRAPATVEPPRSRLPSAGTVARDSVVLKWTAVENAISYDLRVTTTSLQKIVLARDLRTTEFRVPSSALESLPPGSRLRWQVIVNLENANPVSSRSFVLELKDGPEAGKQSK